MVGALRYTNSDLFVKCKEFAEEDEK